MATVIHFKIVDNIFIMMEVIIVCLVLQIAHSALRPLNVQRAKVLINLIIQLLEVVHAEIHNISGLETSNVILVTVESVVIFVEMVMVIVLVVSKIGQCIMDNVHVTHQIFFCQINV